MSTTQSPSRSLRSKARFQKHAETMFRQSNPNAEVAEIDWQFVGPVCEMKGAPGKMRHGRFHATAPGYGTVLVNASETTHGFSIRPAGRVR
jgi:hypothetical protein